MEHSIGVGAIIGLITATSIYVWQSKSFTQTQKTILLICIVFAPLQWLGIIVFSIYNKMQLENSPEKIAEKKSEAVKIKLDSTIENLKDLKEKGILSEEEYKQKTKKLESEKAEQDLKNSTEYKQLKSLLDSGVLTKDEFESKINLLKTLDDNKKTTNEKEKIKAVDFKSKEQEINEFKYEISVWQKLTNFDKELGKYYTYEIISPSSKMNGFEYCETVSTSQFFVKNENKMYYSAEELIFDKFNIKVILK